jgi:hypothetical protein
MLMERVLKKTAQELSDMGWNQQEIVKALTTMNGTKESINIAMPNHFKAEAKHHARCHCLYQLGLSEGSEQYKRQFNKAYKKYLTEAWMNSRGVEDSGDVKKSNPAGIELNVFDALEAKTKTKIVDNKDTLKKKASPGVIHMGKDAILQNSLINIYNDFIGNRGLSAEQTKALMLDIMTQYSAAVTSLSNTFLFAFGKYNTKRKYSGIELYDQNEEGSLESKSGNKPMPDLKPLEFNKLKDKPNKTDADIEELQNVTYRQMTRQIYLFMLSSIVSMVSRLDSDKIQTIERSVRKLCLKMWNGEKANPNSKYYTKDRTAPIKLGFLLRRKTRRTVINFFWEQWENEMYGRPLSWGKKKTKKTVGALPQQSLFEEYDDIKAKSIRAEFTDKMAVAVEGFNTAAEKISVADIPEIS